MGRGSTRIVAPGRQPVIPTPGGERRPDGVWSRELPVLIERFLQLVVQRAAFVDVSPRVELLELAAVQRVAEAPNQSSV